MPRPAATHQRDAEATKASILDAAEEEFAQNGLLGARTESIAARTGVTKAMIHYYYKSKEGLYEAVLERAFLERLRALQGLELESLPADEALRVVIDQFIDSAAEHTRLSAIFMYEAIQNKGKYYNKLGVITLYGTIAHIIERGVKAGLFRDADPKHTAVNIVGMCIFYFCARENVKHLWDSKPLLTKEMMAQHKQEATAMVLNGLRR